MAAKDNKESRFNEILTALQSIHSGPKGQEREQYKIFYTEILSRCIADVAGVLQLDERTPDGESNTKLGELFNKLTKKQTVPGAQKIILENIHGYVKGLVNTPHPTELMNKAAIEAEEEVIEALLEARGFFVRKAKPYASQLNNETYVPSAAEYKKLSAALTNLSAAVCDPISKPLTIDEEMRRSVAFSQRQFDSIPILADKIMASVRLDKLSPEQLGLFSHLIEPETWSPGDQDSKPDMTAEKLQRGINLGRRAMMFHYYRTLAVLGANSELLSLPDDTKEKINTKINTMMIRLLKAGYEAYDNGQKPEFTADFADAKMRGKSKSNGGANEDFSGRWNDYANSEFMRDFKDRFNTIKGTVESYKDSEAFLIDLYELRGMEGIGKIKDAKLQKINSIDSLILQTMNFGDTALRAQIRQNAEMHEKVVNKLLSLVPDKLPDGVKIIPIAEDEKEREQQQKERGGSSERIEKLMNAFKSDRGFADLIKNKVNEELKAIGSKLQEIDREAADDAAKFKKNQEEKRQNLMGEKISEIEINKILAKDTAKFKKKQEQKRNDMIETKIGKDNHDFYQTMESFGLAASNPDRIPRYLIAECRSKTDMLEAFFLLKVMESLRAPDAEKKVEIVNLVEHPDLVKDAGKGTIAMQMSVGALENEQFRLHHLNIESSRHLLRDYSIGSVDFRKDKLCDFIMSLSTEPIVKIPTLIDTLLSGNAEPIGDKASFARAFNRTYQSNDLKKSVSLSDNFERSDLEKALHDAMKVSNGKTTLNALKSVLALVCGKLDARHPLQHYQSKTLDEDRGDIPLTVGDVRQTYGLQIDKSDPHNNHEVVGVKMMMGAGSDVTKAGGIAAAAAMLDAIEKTREAFLNDPQKPILLRDYLGCGSGVHRTHPVSTSFETVQGRGMRQSPESIAQKVLGLLTDFLHRKLSMDTGEAQETTLGKPMSMPERTLLCQVNLSNLAHLDRNDAIWNADTKPRTYAMMEKYEELYKSPEFRCLLGYSADAFANLTKFAARPAARVKPGKEEQKGFPAPVNVKDLRAIGFGAALNAAGICAPLFFGGSEYLKGDLDKKEDLDTLRKMYLFDPKAQDTINRMTYGVIMADMNVAWEYLGKKNPPEPSELETLANSPVQCSDTQKPTPAEMRAMAEKCLAQIHLEYNEVAGRLLRLHQSLTNSLNARPAAMLRVRPAAMHKLVAGRLSHVQIDGGHKAEELLETLPTVLREQLKISRENLLKPRHALASLFDKMASEGNDPKKIDRETSEEYKNIIYPAMGTVFECFEHTPRAYSLPEWVVATDPQMQTRMRERVVNTESRIGRF